MENVEMKTLTWRINGEFITQLAREKFYEEGKLDFAIRLLEDCMQTSDDVPAEERISDEERLGMIMKILDGRAELRGTYPDADYGYYECEIPNEDFRLSRLDKKMDEIKELKEELRKLNEKWSYLSEEMSLYDMKKLDEAYLADSGGEHLFSRAVRESRGLVSSGIGDKMLDSFMKMQKADTTDDYGWLEPSGKFHAVEWGDHQQWAFDNVGKICNMSRSEVLDEFSRLENAGDRLVERGWVLLHSPGHGVPVITASQVRNLTKAQREFLYDYYIKRDCHDEANALFAE